MSIFSQVTAKALRQISHSCVGADPLDPYALRHDGSPDRIDEDGHSKRMIYERVEANDLAFFGGWAKTLNSGSAWRGMMVSTRTFLRKEGKARPIDVPPEMKRLYALWVRHHLEKVIEEAKWLGTETVGFRRPSDLLVAEGRPKGFTIQDCYASTVLTMVRDHGPWAVSIDLRDAFGNLPHKAIREALRELGISGREIRRLIELVRIRTRMQDGTLLRPKDYGIEQGNPLGPMVWNITHGLVVRRLRDRGIASANYGDDVVLAAPTEKAARDAFDVYADILAELGFTNLRGLNAGRKATRIYDTQTDPVPLLKTFLVSPTEVCLTAEKEEALIGRLKAGESLKAARRKCRWKSVSKGYLRQLLADLTSTTPLGTSPRPASPEGYPHPHQGDEGRAQPVAGNPPEDGADSSYADAPRRRTSAFGVGDGNSSPLTLPSYRQMDDPVLPDSGMQVIVIDANTAPATGEDEQLGGDPNDGRWTSPRRPTEGGIQPAADKAAMEHRPALSKSVSMQALLDLRGITTTTSASQVVQTINARCRAASVHGRLSVLVHPGDPFVGDTRILGGEHDARFRLARTRTHREGLVYELRRRRPAKERLKPVVTPPPEADLVIERIGPVRRNAREWKAIWRIGGQRKKTVFTVTTLNPSLARLEVIADLLTQKSPRTVALPSRGGTAHFLTKSSKPAAVSLRMSLQVLRSWRWSVTEDWVHGAVSITS